MSGHSKWSTIKRQKEATDAKRGLLFSKLARAITIAAKDGAISDSNFKLRLAIERARAANMPKDNIDRAISRADGGESVDEVTYEGFGPNGIAVVVQAVTDNKNRTAQEIKNLFERSGGRLGTPGSVTYQFEQVGQLVVTKKGNSEELILELIDAGAQDVDTTDEGIEVYVASNDLAKMREEVLKREFEVKRAELFLKPKTLVTVSDKLTAKKVISFLELLQTHDDVQSVYANVDIQFL